MRFFYSDAQFSLIMLIGTLTGRDFCSVVDPVKIGCAGGGGKGTGAQ